MKKLGILLLMILVLVGLSACSGDTSQETSSAETDGQVIDVDLTKLSSTMVYAEVYNMMVNPEEYYGLIVKMKGEYVSYTSSMTGVTYLSVIIADATGCCEQGIEFLLDESYVYPDDYPTPGDTITVVGEFESYLEMGIMYCRLKDGYLP